MTITYDCYMRQIDVISPDEIPPITIIGSGASGTGIGVIAGKLGCQNITIWDGDQVELHNVSNQYFSGNSIGINKATALRTEIMRLAPVLMTPSIISMEEMFEENSDISSQIVFLCVDGIENRRSVFNRLTECTDVRWIIETRMSAEYYEVNTIDMSSDEEKASWLESLDGPMREEPCTARSVIYTIMLMSARAVYFMKKIAKNDPVPKHYSENLNNSITPPYIEWRLGEDPRRNIGVQQNES